MWLVAFGSAASGAPPPPPSPMPHPPGPSPPTPVVMGLDQGFLPTPFVPKSSQSRFVCPRYAGRFSEPFQFFLIVKSLGEEEGCVIAGGPPEGFRLPSGTETSFLFGSRRMCCEVSPLADGGYPHVRVDLWDQDRYSLNDYIGGATITPSLLSRAELNFEVRISTARTTSPLATATCGGSAHCHLTVRHSWMSPQTPSLPFSTRAI